MPTDAIRDLRPASLWRRFAELSGVPRESKHEKAAGDFVAGIARNRSLSHVRDRHGNVVVRKPASPGLERRPSVCLQSHLDMVCVKRSGVAHDFAKDPIRLVRNGDIVGADGTTLGADNGIGVAACLALMDEADLVHGPLELLFTVDEETGLTGARRLAPDVLTSRILINLDTEDEGVLCVGCAGGQDTIGTWELHGEAVTAGMVAVSVQVSGLRGGHSGTEIHQGRGNAIKLLARMLVRLGDFGARVVRSEGGSKRNAIPAEAAALVVVPNTKLDGALAAAAELVEVLRDELRVPEPALRIQVVRSPARPSRTWPRRLQRQLLQVLSGLPHGVVRMSAEIAGLVGTSTNVAVLRQTNERITLATSQRSLAASELAEIAGAVQAILELGGATVGRGDPYPGWKPNPESHVLGIAIRTYQELFGRDPKVEAVHAGLECGIIGERYPGMDMVSLGPTIRDAHSPAECVDIPSVGRFWDYLLAILENVE